MAAPTHSILKSAVQAADLAVTNAATPDPNPGDESDTATTIAVSADLSVTNFDTPDPVLAGSNLTYTIVLTNAGPSDFTLPGYAGLSDALPAGTTFVSLAAPAGWSCETPAVGGTGAVRCQKYPFAVGSAEFTLTVKVAASLPAGAVVTNTAYGGFVVVVLAGQGDSVDPDPDPANNSSTASTLVAASSDLHVTNIDSPDPVLVGGKVTYDIMIGNVGPSNAASPSLSDTLPAGTTFVSLAAPAGWTCITPAVGAGGTVSCNSVTLAPLSALFTLVVNVAASLPGGTVLSNTATASSASDPDPANNSVTATTTVLSPAAISATKAVAGALYAGGAVVYTIVLTNNAATAQGDNPGDEFVDALPPELVLVSANATSGTAIADVPGNTVRWTGGNFGGGSVTITIQARVANSVVDGQVVSNQGTAYFDADGNGANESQVVTDNAGSSPGSGSATVFVAVRATPAIIPALAGSHLLALAALLALIGVLLLRWRKRS
ncbi:MAG: DUF11 domain-containing protein [Betaproteobacteria bacterium]|nr:DUF11 domain-containing protein [Betaproteobacteria bacterium]